jgi:hypothetical protein
MRLFRIPALLVTVALLACSPETPTAPATTKAPDEAAAIQALKDITQAQADFIRRTRRYAQSYDELIADHLLSAEPSTEQTGYKIDMRPSPDAVSYTVSATPSGSAEARHFFTDQTGGIHVETGKPATADSPKL